MYEPVIGLEIHLQVQTKSKMFCRCPNDSFDQKPNIHTCPVCLGLPGALPVPNIEAFEKAVKFAIAIGCTVPNITKFDRKNYFYPDLAKGYQITQYDQPIGENGYLEIEVEGDLRRIRIKRLHLEEDTAKSIHLEGEKTYIDYNKSGVPLIEIVTEPDFISTDEVIAFAKRLRQIVRYLEISEGEMQKGQIRFEVNMSLRTPNESGSHILPNYKVEVKNIGSISVLEKVIEFEFSRQKELLESGETIKTQTRGLKDMSGETMFQRFKESADDYRYFPEPDITPILISKETIERLTNQIPVLPAMKKYFYTQLGLELEQADFFVEDLSRANWFDQLIYLFAKQNSIEFNFSPTAVQKLSELIKISPYNLIKEAAKWFIGDIAGLIQKKGVLLEELPITQQDVIEIVLLVKDNKITGTVAKNILEAFFDGKYSKVTFAEVIKTNNLELNLDNEQLESWVEQSINDNPDIVKSILSNPNAIKALVGKVMKISSGKASPQLAEKMIKEKLSL
jgi:aspartyl-tRNA(Asn)/glutamyl-tRNA(Gln) amidotransferase subunit B